MTSSSPTDSKALVLLVQPNPPSLVCIDEPDQGVHPRTFPILAGLFEKACDRTQILLATHASYFLMQFDLSRIAVMRKRNGEAEFIKPKDSKTLNENLADFGPEEIEIMHRSDGWGEFHRGYFDLLGVFVSWVR